MEFRQEFKSCLKTRKELNSFFPTWDFPLQFSQPLMLPIRLAKKIKERGQLSPLGKLYLPQEAETSANGIVDPIGDQKRQVTPMLIHRYKNRALFIPTSICPVQCRYCFRKNELHADDPVFQASLKETFDYLMEHSEIEEIIFSGGDPLILSNERLDSLVQELSKIPHIKYLRFHTKTPVVLPSRVDHDFLCYLRKWNEQFESIAIVLHLSHADEIDEEFIFAIEDIQATDVVVLAQSVLLKGVNDCPKILKSFYQTLAALQIRPYYLHHPDPVRGGMHFWLPLEVGQKIIGQLKNDLPGYLLPQYVIDSPQAVGKQPALNLKEPGLCLP